MSEKKEKEKRPGAWLTVEEVAQVMDVSRDTVARLIASGSLPAVLIHSGKRKRTYRVRPAVFESWASSRERSHEQAQGKTAMRKPRLRIDANGLNILRSFQNGDRAPTEAEKNVLLSTPFGKDA